MNLAYYLHEPSLVQVFRNSIQVESLGSGFLYLQTYISNAFQSLQVNSWRMCFLLALEIIRSFPENLLEVMLHSQSKNFNIIDTSDHRPTICS